MRTHIIAVNYFGSSHASALLQSLQGQRNSDWALVVVDNSCSQAEFDNLSRAVAGEPRCRLLRTPRNLGYYGAAQFALERSAFSRAYVIVANMDITFPDPACLELLSEKKLLGVGVVAPSVLSRSMERDQNPYMIHRPTRASMLRRRMMFQSRAVGRVIVFAAHFVDSLAGKRAFQLKKHRRHVRPSPKDRCKIYAGHGCCSIFTPDYLAAGGDFRHPVLLFGEEITVGERCRTLGLSVIYDPTLVVVHSGHQSTGVWRSRGILDAQRDATSYAYRLIKDGK